MAKGARASSKKANRTKLRARVFGPVEQARAERLHAKMLEIIQQPKPERTEMDTAEDGKLPKTTPTHMIADYSKATTADEATKEDDLPKGSFILTAPIPPSLYDSSSTVLEPVQEETALSNLYHHLGLCSDIVGFTDDGDLKFAFDPLPPHWLSKNQGLTVPQ
jgi:hypothetical protein